MILLYMITISVILLILLIIACSFIYSNEKPWQMYLLSFVSILSIWSGFIGYHARITNTYDFPYQKNYMQIAINKLSNE